MVIKKSVCDRLYFKSSLLDNVWHISHCFSSKLGGASCGKINGLNLGFRVGDEKEAVFKNYSLIAGDFEFDFSKITAAKQTHSSKVTVVDETLAGCGVSRLDETFETDALVTNLKGVTLTVFYADCVPILLVDEAKSVIAAVHSGWRGTVSKIAQKTVETMVGEFGCSASNIKAAIGPSICRGCFETGTEVACEFDGDLVDNASNGKFKVDLWEANRRILEDSGVPDENIDILGICTMCERDKLYSYRVDKDKTGRMGAFIMLK